MGRYPAGSDTSMHGVSSSCLSFSQLLWIGRTISPPRDTYLTVHRIPSHQPWGFASYGLRCNLPIGSPRPAMTRSIKSRWSMLSGPLLTATSIPLGSRKGITEGKQMDAASRIQAYNNDAYRDTKEGGIYERMGSMPWGWALRLCTQRE